jgi:hypothetical protein
MDGLAMAPDGRASPTYHGSVLRPRTAAEGLPSRPAVHRMGLAGGKMAPSRLGLAPLRRVVGATLVVLLLVGAVLYYRAPPSSPVAALSPSTRPSADGSSVPDAEPLPSTPNPQATGSDGSPSAEVAAIEIYGDRAIKAQPFETVRIRGTYHGGAEAFLRVDVREGARWVPYPFRPKTDHLGRFITHIELGEPGPHWLRVVDPRTELTSEPFVLVIAG